MLLWYTAALFSWPLLVLSQQSAQLRSHIQALDLYDDVEETDEQALARYEKEEMNMSCLSCAANLLGIALIMGDTSRGDTQLVVAGYYACVACSSMQDIIAR